MEPHGQEESRRPGIGSCVTNGTFSWSENPQISVDISEKISKRTTTSGHKILKLREI